MADPLSARNWLGWETLDVKGNRIGGGTFDPIPSLGASPGDVVVSSEKTTETTVGTETTRKTSETQRTVNTALWTDWLVRGVVILLGFVFVAVGLTMFKPTAGIVKEAVPG